MLTTTVVIVYLVQTAILMFLLFSLITFVIVVIFITIIVLDMSLCFSIVIVIIGDKPIQKLFTASHPNHQTINIILNILNYLTECLQSVCFHYVHQYSNIYFNNLICSASYKTQLDLLLYCIIIFYMRVMIGNIYYLKE